MKDEKKLLDIPLQAPPEYAGPQYIEEKRTFTWSGESYIRQIANRLISAEMIPWAGSHILIVTCYDWTGCPLWRTFQGKDEHRCERFTEHINSYKSVKLKHLYSTGVWNLENGDFQSSCGDIRAVYHFSPETLATVSKFTSIKETDKNPLQLIFKFQQDYAKRKIEEKHQRIRRSIDDAMLEIKPTPSDFKDWILKEPMKDKRYIFYAYTGKKEQGGWCSYCKKEVVVRDAKNRQIGHCPACRSQVTYLAVGQYLRTYGFTDSVKIAYIQKTKTGVCIRLFDASINYNGTARYRETELYIREKARVFFEGDKIGQVFSTEGSNYAVTDRDGFHKAWINEIDIYADIYPRNLRKIFSGGAWKYCQMPEIARNAGKLNVIGFLTVPLKWGSVEYIAKAGLWRLAAELIDNRHGGKLDGVEPEGKGLKGVLGVNRDDMPMLAMLNVNHYELTAYREIKAREGKINPEHILWMRAKGIRWPDYGWAMEFMTMHKIIKYVDEQLRKGVKKKTWNGEAPILVSDILHDWKDYIKDCIQLKYPMDSDFVLFPADLQEAHQRVGNEWKDKKNEIVNEQIRALTDRLNNNYEHKSKKLLIRAPMDYEEIKTEGAKLSHCVSRYGEDMARGETIILFIRKLDSIEKPYFTLELNPKDLTVRQCRGKNNCGMTNDVKEFVDAWTKIINKRKETKINVA